MQAGVVWCPNDGNFEKKAVRRESRHTAWKNLRLCVFDKEHGVDRNVDRRDVYVELLVGSRVKRIQTVLGRTENAPQVAAGRFVEDLIAVLNERADLPLLAVAIQFFGKVSRIVGVFAL